MRRTARLAVLATAAATVPVFFGFSEPAQAACSTTTELVSSTASNSDTFSAHSNCDGVWGVQWVNAVANKYAKGQYNSGGWKDSSYGWVFVPTSGPGNEKLVGNTIDGRVCRVVAQSGTSSMYLKY